MSLFNKIKSAFENQEKQKQGKIVIEPDEAPEMVRRSYSEQIETAKEHEKELIQDTDRLLQELEENLEEVEEYEDVEGIKAAEDIAQSFYNSRKILIENFDPENDSEKYEEKLQEFISDFNDVDRKEKALMERMKSDVVGIAENVQRLGDKLEEIREFNEEGKKMLHDIDKLEEISEQYNETANMIGEKEKLKDEKEKEIERLESRLEDKREEKEKLKESQEWKKKQEKEDEISSLEEEIKKSRKRLSSSVSNLERGLKKLIYQIENQDLKFSGSLQNLKNLKQENFEQIKPVDEDLEEARAKIEEEDLLSGRQLEEFTHEVDNHPEYISEIEKISDLKEKKKEIEKDLKDSTARKKKKNIENKIKELEDKIKAKEKEKDKIRESLDDLREQKESIKNRIKEKTEELMDEPVKFKEAKENQH